MKKIGIGFGPLIRRYGIERALELGKGFGFDAVDISLGAYSLNDEIYGGSDDAFESHFYAIRKKAEDLELEISQTHANDTAYPIDNEQRREITDKTAALDLKATSILGAPACVFHFIITAVHGKQSPEYFHKVSGEMFDKMVPFADKYKTKIALENFGAALLKGERTRDFFADPIEIKRQFDRLNTKYKTFCLDTGHAHEAESFWVPPSEEIIRFYGKDLTVLHLNDNGGTRDDHLIPGMGTVNWPAVFDALDDVGYEGVYNFELNNYFAGRCALEYYEFVGKSLRAFVDNHGRK